MFHLPFLLPTAALLHIGQWAISRRLDLAHCPICWVPPTYPKQMRSFSLHAKKEQIDLLASLGELFAPSSLSPQLQHKLLRSLRSLRSYAYGLHAQKEQIDLLATLGELFAPSSLSFVLLFGSLLVK